MHYFNGRQVRYNKVEINSSCVHQVNVSTTVYNLVILYRAIKIRLTFDVLIISYYER